MDRKTLTDPELGDRLVAMLEGEARGSNELGAGLKKLGLNVEKSQRNRVLSTDGRFEKKGQLWGLRTRCFGGCRAAHRFRVGSTCVHLGPGLVGEEDLRALIAAIRRFSPGAAEPAAGADGGFSALLRRAGA